jgi:uncharacterized phage-associated protein
MIRIEAWRHGPVVRKVYKAYSRFGDEAIAIPDDFDIAKYDEMSLNLLDEVYQVYWQYSAWKLAAMTHGEPPWLNAYRQGLSTIITQEALTEYFSTLVE